MTNIFSRQQWRLKQRWYSDEEARRIAYVQQQRLGNLATASFRLSNQWEEYSNLSPEQRAILRRSKISWKPTYHYMYIWGRVVLKPQYKWA